MRRTAILTLLLLMPSPGYAEQADQDTRDRVMIAGVFGATTADAAARECCELRTPPALRTFDESSIRPVLGVDVRFFWHERTSTFVHFESSAERSFQFTYPRPASPPVPFLTYEAERRVSSRHQTWTVGQTYEVGTAGAVRPWLFGALGVDRLRKGSSPF